MRYVALTLVAAAALLCGQSRPAAPPALAVTFDRHKPGVYTAAMLRQDCPTLEYGDLSKRGTIVDGGQRGRCLRMKYPKGSLGPSEGGGVARAKLKPRDEYTLEFAVLFEQGFDWVKGGKLHGLGGGTGNTGGKKPTGDGWSVRYMWKDGGKAIMYVYHADQKGIYGDAFSLPTVFEPDRWYTLKQRVRVNTVGQANGELEVWVDGKQVLLKKDLRYRTVDGAQVDLFLFSTFHGGSTRDWSPTRDCHARFDNIIVR